MGFKGKLILFLSNISLKLSLFVKFLNSLESKLFFSLDMSPQNIKGKPSKALQEFLSLLSISSHSFNLSEGIGFLYLAQLAQL